MKRKSIICGVLALALLAGCGEAGSASTVLDEETAVVADEGSSSEGAGDQSAEGASSEVADAAAQASSEAAEDMTDDAILKDLCSNYFTL